MTRNFFSIMTIAIIMMVSANSFAQGHSNRRGSEVNNNRGGNREMSIDQCAQMARNSRSEARYSDSRNDNRYMGGRDMNSRDMRDGRMMNNSHNVGHYSDRGHVANGHRDMYPAVDGRGYVPGWEGRVMHRDGRWGYLRGSDWYWYDCYYEPDFYFAHPVAHFHSHLIPMNGRVANGVVAGVATAVAVGALINALCH